VVPGPRQGASDASPASLQNSEAKSEAPPPAPLPAALPRLSETELKASQIWVQLASTPDRGMLPAELGRLRHKARGDLNAYNAYVQQSGAANRLLVGPFKSNADASRLEDRLEDRHIDALVSRTPAGSDISPL
jgi:cell division septation protein DedD